MDDHRRSDEGYAATVAVTPSGARPAGVPALDSARTELASGTGLRAEAATDKTGPVIGGTIGRFSVTSRIGADPIGVVYGARDEAGRAWAVKLVHAPVAHAAYRARLAKQAAALAQVGHGSLVAIEEIGVAFGRPFVAMELVAGPLLPAWLETPRSWAAIVDVFAQIASALDVAHRAGFGHGDWTPACVLVEPSGRPRVIDVGLGRFDPQGDGKVDPRVDQLRVAVALREALGGGSDGDPARWGAVPEPVRLVVARAVDVTTPGGYASLGELVAALERARGQRVESPRAPAERRLVMVLAGLVLVVGAAAAAYELTPTPAAPAAAPIVAPAPIVARPPAEPRPPPPAPAPLADPPPPAPPPPPPPPPKLRAAPGPTPVTHAPPAPAPPPQSAPAPAAPAVTITRQPATAPPSSALDAIRAAIETWGYEGIADSAIAAPTGTPTPLEVGSIQVRQAAAERRRGDCARTTAIAHAAIQMLGQSEEVSAAATWAMRARLQVGLCELARGHFAAAIVPLREVVAEAEGLTRREALFAEAIALWASDDLADARAALKPALLTRDPRDPVAAAYVQLRSAIGLTQD